jgi:hypothetical protein
MVIFVALKFKRSSLALAKKRFLKDRSKRTAYTEVINWGSLRLSEYPIEIKLIYREREMTILLSFTARADIRTPVCQQARFPPHSFLFQVRSVRSA